MSGNPLEFAYDWPGVGSGHHSELSKKHYEWIRHITIALSEMKLKSDAQEIKITQLDAIIKQQKTQIEFLTNNPPENANPIFSFSDLVKENNKKTEADVVLLAKVHSELKEKSRIERNIVISGLQESTGNNDEEKETNEANLIDELLSELKVDKSKVKRKARLRKKDVAQNAEKPSLLLIEFVDSNSQTTALSNSTLLKNKAKFNRVYVNCDKTMAEREAEAKLRHKRNELNEKLPNGGENGVLRYGTRDNNKRYYWGIRDGRLVQLEPRQ